MPDVYSAKIALTFLVYAILFGFGFAIGGWLWSVLIGAVRRG
jgi:hypothetical protein